MRWQDKVLDQPSWHFNSGSPGTIFKICSKLTIKKQERSQWRRSFVFIVNFEQNSLNVLVFPLLTLNKQVNHFYKVWGERGWTGGQVFVVVG